MWILYILNKKNGYNGQAYKRLRPNNSYDILERKNVLAFTLEVGNMTENQVEDPNFRPEVKLVKEKNIRVKLDDSAVTETETIVMDQQRIIMDDNLTQYRLQWEELNIYHSTQQGKEQIQKDHAMLLEAGGQYGFHVSQRYNRRTTTHCFLSHSQDCPVEPSAALLLALCQKKIFITKLWIDGLSVSDEGFNLIDYNGTATPIEIQNWGPWKNKLACFGPSNKRKTLFDDSEFWFFDSKQHEQYKELIELCSGRSRLITVDEAMASENDVALWVETPDTEGFAAVRERYSQTHHSQRCILSWEIYFSIVYASISEFCNPMANLHTVLDPNSPYTQSLPQTVRIKEEPTSEAADNIHDLPTVPYDHSVLDTVPYQDDDEHDTVAAIEYTAPRIKEEVFDRTVDDVMEGTEDDRVGTVYETAQDMEGDMADTVPARTGETQERIVNDPHRTTEQVEDISVDNNDNEMEDIVPESFSLPELPEDLEDMDDWFGNAISSQSEKKRAERQEKQKREQLEKEKKEKERQEYETQQRQHLERLQRLEQEKRERERQRREREAEQRVSQPEGQDATITQGHTEETLNDNHNTSFMEDNQEDTFVNDSSMDVDDTGIDDDNTGMDVDDTTMNADDNQSNTYNRQDTDVGEGQYIKVVYAPLVVKPRPRSLPAPTVRRSGVNFKKFVKTRQLQTMNVTDIVTLLTSSQIPQQQRAGNRPREVNVRNTAEFDPDIAITTARRRVR